MDKLSGAPVKRIAKSLKLFGLCRLLVRYVLATYMSMMSVPIGMFTTKASTTLDIVLERISQSTK